MDRQKKIDDVIGGLETILHFDVDDKSQEIDRIQEELRDAIRAMRRKFRDKCMDILDQAKTDLAEFNHTMDLIQQKIDETNKEIQKFKKAYNYPDKERTKD